MVGPVGFEPTKIIVFHRALSLGGRGLRFMIMQKYIKEIREERI